MDVPQFNVNQLLPPNIEMKQVDHGAMLEREQEKLRHLDSIEKYIDAMSSDLRNEKEERKQADAESIRYIKKWNRLSLAVGVVAVLVAVASLAVAIFK